MSKYPSQMQDKFNLRFPDGMRDAIAERAKANGRSMNSEIVQILDDALNAKVISWSDLQEDSDDESESEIITVSMKQMNKFISLASEEAAKAVVENLSENYNITPRTNKKPT